MKKLRKLLVIGVMVLSVIAMSGIVVAPASAAASTGDLIKMSGNSSVYYLGADGKRYVFPNSTTYFSWYKDFSGVVTIPAAELQSYPLGGNVTMRPGTKLVKITTDPSVYAVEPNGTLRKIQSEAQASALYGTNWNKRVVDVPDAFFVNYTLGSALPNGAMPIGSLVKNASGASVYYYDGTNYRTIATESAFNANRFSFSNVLTTTSTISAGGSAISGAEFVNVAQNGGTGTVITGSGLMVSLNSATPASNSIPKGAVNVPFTKVNFTAANDGAVTVNTISFTRTGVGSASDFVNVYLYDGATRLTSGRTVNSSSNKVTFTGLNFNIPAGQTKSLTLTADISATGHNDAFGIAAASDISSTGATVSGSFPITGNVMSIVDQTTGHVTITKSGSWAAPKVGQAGAKVGEFQLQTTSVEDIKVSGLTLYQAGTINNSYLTNFKLTQAGTTIATATGVNSNNQITFNFTSPFLITKGGSNNFEIYADINSGARSGDTINLYLDNDADLLAVGQTYGYGVAVSRSAGQTPAGSYDGTTGNSSLSTIDASQLTFSFQGPASADYSTQQKAIVLASYNVTAQNNLEIRKTYLRLVDTNGYLYSNSNANFTNVRLINHANNAQLAGGSDVPAATSPATTTTVADFTFTDVWNINAGQTITIDVVADVANYAPVTNETVTATLGLVGSNVLFGNSDVKNLDNNTFIANEKLVPSTPIVGNPMNIKSSSASVTMAGTPTANTVINGAQNVPMVGVNVTAGTGKDVKLSAIKFTATSTVTGCTTNVSNCILDVKLYDGTTQIGTAQSLSSNTVTFNNLNYTVTKGTTKTLTAVADLNTLSGTPTGYVLLSVGSGDVTAQDINGNTVNVSGTIVGQQQTVTGAGTLSTTKSADIIGSTDSRLVVAGNTDQPIASFHFSAQNESLKLQKLRILIAGLTATTTAGGAATTTNAASYITNVSLWNGSTKVADYVTPSYDGTNAIADFSSTVSDFIVPSNGSADLTVKVSYNSNFNTSLKTGVKLTATLDGTNANFKFVGANSSTVITTTTTTAGNPVYLFKSIPTISNAPLSTTVLTAGNQTLAKYTVTADAKGAIDWRTMKFTVSPSNIGNIDTFTLVDENNNSVAACTATVSTSSPFTVNCVKTSDNQVAAGSSKTYSLKANVTLASGNTNSASLSTIFNRVATNAYAPDSVSANLNTNGGNFIWSDESGAPHVDGTSTDYFGDFLIKNLPTDSQTLSK